MINHLQEMLDKLCSIHPHSLMFFVGGFNRLHEKFLLQFLNLNWSNIQPGKREYWVKSILIKHPYFFNESNHKATLGRCDHNILLLRLTKLQIHPP